LFIVYCLFKIDFSHMQLSEDHPFNGGTGKYEKEYSRGLTAAGPTKGQRPANGLGAQQATHIKQSRSIEKLTVAAQKPVVDPQKYLEQIRREQNELMLRMLEEERAQEEERVQEIDSMRKEIMSTYEEDTKARLEEECSRLELVFAEERQRASERIILTTKNHEARVKEIVLSMMHLGNKQ
jgi:hypothetical protein